MYVIQVISISFSNPLATKTRTLSLAIPKTSASYKLSVNFSLLRLSEQDKTSLFSQVFLLKSPSQVQDDQEDSTLRRGATEPDFNNFDLNTIQNS